MEEFRTCLSKQFALWQHRLRDARSQSRRRDPPSSHDAPAVAPFLWVITAGVPTTLFTELHFEPAPGWPPGVYLFGNNGLRVGLVVGSMLPRERSTLLVRLIAAGSLLANAVGELASLPLDAIERAVAEPVLLDLQRTLGQSSSHGLDEQEFLMVMLKSWEDGKAEARREGRLEMQVNAVLTALRVRGIQVPAAGRDRILAEKDMERLQRWLEKAIVAACLEDVIDTPV